RALRARLDAGATDPLAGLPDDATVFADDDAASVAREVRRRLAEEAWISRPAPRRRFAWVAALAAAGLLFFVLPRATPDPIDEIGLRGPAAVSDVYRSTGSGQAERLGDGVLAARGDRVQVTFRAPGARYVLVVSV